ncbi:hypothetical protein [Brachybacterium sp. 107]|uniref:hypothetical protein n=1 Tax=Brachybacterium sp. 107 TaxID=3457736 RepID=UPI004033430A
MKHVQRRTALAALAGLVVLGAAPAAFAEGEGDEVSESELQEARDLIAEVDSDLAAQGTSVREQLALLEEETGETFIAGVQARGGKVSEEDLLRAAVASIAASFTALNFKLAAELLIRSTKKDGGIYFPKFGTRASSSPVISKIKKGAPLAGSSAFKKTSGGSYSADLYYAIHKFNFSKTGVNNPKVTVTDVYDFATEKYQGIQGKAVATMALAQKKGVVKKYTLRITV